MGKISEQASLGTREATAEVELIFGGTNYRQTVTVLFTGYATEAYADGLVAGLGTASTLDFDTDGTLAANSDSKIATQKATKTYVDTAVTGLLDFKGSTDASANPNYPAALKGDAYIITVAGKIGGASGKSVDVGDVYLATADNAGGTEASVGTSWAVLEHNLVGALLSANNLSDLANAGTARTNLGLGTIATQNANGVSISGGSITGITDLAISDGGTGASTATAAFNALSPVTTRGDLITRDATNNVRLGIGASARILQSDGTDPSWVAVSGDATIAAGGALTIAADAITYSKLQNVSATSRIIGRKTAGSGDPEELTPSDVISMLGISGGGGSGGLYEAAPTKPLASAFTLQNAGTASMADGTFGLILTMPSSTVNIRFMKYNAGVPGSSWTIISRASSLVPYSTANIHHGSILLRNSSNGRLINFAHNGVTVVAQRWSSYTGFNASIYTGPNITFGQTYGWKKVTSDGTTLSFYMGSNGSDWALLGTETIATYIGTPDEIGIGSVNGAASSVTNYDIFESFSVA